MNTAQAFAIVVVALALLAIAYMFIQQQNAAAARARLQNPWNQLGSGFGQVVSSIGGFVNGGN